MSFDLETLDPSYLLVFEGEWYSYEEGGFLYIFEKDDEFFYIEENHYVYCESEPDSCLTKISLEDALDLISEWENNRIPLEDI